MQLKRKNLQSLVRTTVPSEANSGSPTSRLFLNARLPPIISRRVEEGVIMKIQPQSFCIIFEKAPIWLLALDPSYVVKIYLSEIFSFDHLYSHLLELKIDQSLYTNVISSLQPSTFEFTSPPNDVVYLISGTTVFLNERLNIIRQKQAIFVTDTSVRTKQVPINLRRLSILQ